MDETKVPKQVGRYEIRSELGRGGMSTVFLAYDPNVDRTVALKLLPREFLHHKEFRARFNREARIIAALEHSAIVPIYDFGDVEGQPFFVMRHMSGGSLAAKVDKGPIPVSEASKIIERIGSALQYAHSKGVVHRDLKPGNILFDQFGTAYLADFGIARLEETGATLTGSVFMGTPAYMSPEQVQAVHDIDGRADIYALGVILYEMLTGIKPYSAKTAAATALKHVTEPVPRILKANPNLPPDMEQVIDKAMAKDPDQRYLLATDLTADVTNLAAGKTLVGQKPPEIPKDVEATMIAPAAGATVIAPSEASKAAEKVVAAESGIEATEIFAPVKKPVKPAEKPATTPVDRPATKPPTGSVAATTAAAAAAAAAEAKPAAAAPGKSAAAPAKAARPATRPPDAAVEAGGGGRRILMFALIGLAVIIILGAIGVGILYATGGGFGSLFGGATDTPTATLTIAPTETSPAEPTETATVAATATSLPTAASTSTKGPTSTPLSQPTLRPTNTVEPTETTPPTRTRAPATNTPVPLPPTATQPPAQPTSPPQQPTSPPPQPTSPPPQPTSPPPEPTRPPI